MPPVRMRPGWVRLPRPALRPTFTAAYTCPYAPRRADATRILREIKLLRLLRHPDIVEIKHIMLPPSARDFKDIYVVFELMETDLHQVPRRSRSRRGSRISCFAPSEAALHMQAEAASHRRCSVTKAPRLPHAKCKADWDWQMHGAHCTHRQPAPPPPPPPPHTTPHTTPCRLATPLPAGDQGQRRPHPGAPPVLPLPDAAWPQVHPLGQGGWFGWQAAALPPPLHAAAKCVSCQFPVGSERSSL